MEVVKLVVFCVKKVILKEIFVLVMQSVIVQVNRWHLMAKASSVVFPRVYIIAHNCFPRVNLHTCFGLIEYISVSLSRCLPPSVWLCQKSMRFSSDATVWVAKQQILCTLTQSLRDVLNYGLFQPAVDGRESGFLEEERPLRDYPLPTNKGVPTLEVMCRPTSMTCVLNCDIKPYVFNIVVF